MHRTALGAQHTVPWEYREAPLPLLNELRSAGVTVAALEITDSPTAIGDLDLPDYPLCLVLGNEVEGVPDELLAHCDYALEIPQYGSKQSLNVSVAYGIAAFRLVERYRHLKLPG